MKSAILALAALLSSPAAFAADLSPQDAPPAPPPAAAFNWGGAYVGGYAGGAFGKNRLINLSGSSDVSLSPAGGTLGGLAGVNYQTGSLVFGAEGEFGYDGWKEGADYLNSRGGTRHAESEGSYMGRLRGRIGYAAGNLLFYSAGGVSFTNDKVTQSNPVSGNSDSIDKGLTGWNIGVGAEYAFNPKWIGRLEYIHDSFGKKTYDFQSLPGGFADREVHLEQNTIRLALAYKF
ncbi:outer membrane protein [Mesorhizobium comanense]|uniref:outer membrane protein n=1 Tax=Mesorhizobium comanense TaxID=2502215 RepID=UPI0010F79C08|nr:outer membrane beta-barrel protein [Mesorhizobium comanense]